MLLRLPAEQARLMLEHLERAYPDEACGILLGRDRGTRREVSRVTPVANQNGRNRRHRFTIAPEDLLAVERDARADGLDVVGFFHSHPDHSARPSAFDLEHAWPYYSYVIVSLERGRVAECRSFRLSEDRARFESEALEVAYDAAPEATESAGEQG